MEASYEIRIPKNRVAVLIGIKGEIKKKIQQATDTVLDIDSSEGLVIISGKDALKLLDAQQIVKAIARGFNPDIAFLLLKSDFMFELIDLKIVSKNKNDMLRLKGRIIGAAGKSRKTIEDLTETYISVFGKTIGIIGEVERVMLAKRAIGQLVEGSPHAHVYRWLEGQRKRFRQESF